jgi:hypothetical protein
VVSAGGEREHDDSAARAGSRPPGAATAAEPPALALQRLVGNRAVGALLARQPAFSDVQIKKRFDVPIHDYTADQVRALYLGAGIVYSGDAWWDDKTSAWIVDRASVSGLSPGRLGAKGAPLPTEDDVNAFDLDAILRSEAVPDSDTSWDVDDFSTAHLNAVKAVINYYIMAAWYATLDEERRPTATVEQILQRAGRDCTIKRQGSDRDSQTLILRDVQRYFYGRIAPFANISKMKSAASSDPLYSDKGPMFYDDPSEENIAEMEAMQAQYEMAKKAKKLVGLDMQATKHPSSAPGGFSWLRKGTEDSANDTAGGRYKEKRIPYLVR